MAETKIDVTRRFDSRKIEASVGLRTISSMKKRRTTQSAFVNLCIFLGVFVYSRLGSIDSLTR
jgi:hypothetical protein